jgi:hypothetical protein
MSVKDKWKNIKENCNNPLASIDIISHVLVMVPSTDSRKKPDPQRLHTVLKKYAKFE